MTGADGLEHVAKPSGGVEVSLQGFPGVAQCVVEHLQQRRGALDQPQIVERRARRWQQSDRLVDVVEHGVWNERAVDFGPAHRPVQVPLKSVRIELDIDGDVGAWTATMAVCAAVVDQSAVAIANPQEHVGRTLDKRLEVAFGEPD